MSENGTEKPKYDGELVKLGGIEYTVPSLSVSQAKKYWPKILDINEGVTVQNLPDKYDSIVEIIHAAISRNYPNVSIESLKDEIDLKNIRRLQLIVTGMPSASPGAVPVAETTVR